MSDFLSLGFALTQTASEGKNLGICVGQAMLKRKRKTRDINQGFKGVALPALVAIRYYFTWTAKHSGRGTLTVQKRKQGWC